MKASIFAQAAITNCHSLGSFNKNFYFTQFGGWKVQDRGVGIFSSAESHLMVVFSSYPPIQALTLLLIRAPILSMRLPSSKPNYFSKTSHSYTIILRDKISKYKFWRTQIFSPQQHNNLSSCLPWYLPSILCYGHLKATKMCSLLAGKNQEAQVTANLPYY